MLHNETHGKLDRLLEAKMATVARNNKIQIDRLELGPVGTNAYVLTGRKTGDGVVIDAPLGGWKDFGGVGEDASAIHPHYA